MSDAFLTKASESLVGATSEFGNGRYNNTANRAYYAAFQAAIAALEAAGIRPAGGQMEWGHGFVRSRFAGMLIYRRKLYSPELRDALRMMLEVRQQGDYGFAPVSATRARRALEHANALVTAVTMRIEGGSK